LVKKTVFGTTKIFFGKNIDFSCKKADNNQRLCRSTILIITEGLDVFRKEVMVKDIDKKYDHPLAEIVQIASQYKSEILLEYDKYRINAKSIMGIIAFNPSSGMNVTISANGKDENEAVEALEKFLICG
jgi:phosphocarrier protein